MDDEDVNLFQSESNQLGEGKRYLAVLVRYHCFPRKHKHGLDLPCMLLQTASKKVQGGICVSLRALRIVRSVIHLRP
jgi:hypothetical protein